MVWSVPACTIQQGIIQFSEVAAAAVRECAVNQTFYNTANFRIFRENLAAVVLRENGFQFFNLCTEDIVAILASFFYDFDICTVISAQRYCTIQHQLHVTSTGGFCTSSRNLFRNISCSYQLFCIGYIVVGNEYHFNQLVHVWVIGNQLANFIDELDDCLCTAIARSRLCTEQECGRGKVLNAAVLDALIEIQDRECIQQLPLVFV